MLFGNAGGNALAPLPPAGRLFAGNVSIGAFSLSRLAVQRPNRVGEALRDALRRLADGTLDVAVSELDGLQAAPGAQQELADGTSRGKRVVAVRPATPLDGGQLVGAT